jgi:hypothetical protein
MPDSPDYSNDRIGKNLNSRSPEQPAKHARIGQAMAIFLLGLTLAVAAMALFVHGDAINQPPVTNRSSVTTTPPPSALRRNP